MQAHTLFLVTAHHYSSRVCGMNIAAGFILSVLLGTVSHQNGIFQHLYVELTVQRKMQTMAKESVLVQVRTAYFYFTL